MKNFLITFFAFFCFTKTFGQAVPSGRISGKVIDSTSISAVEYATVAVIDDASGKIVNGIITDPQGAFVITGLQNGKYSLSIEFIGYKKGVVGGIQLRDDSRNISVRTIRLVPSVQMLGAVTVTGKAEIVENKIDKIVYNAANDITSQAGAAIDVLRKVPQVSVDIDGNVELQGNPNVRFLINGKPSSVFGNSLTDALSSIPASQIKSVEAITSPGAKYDAQGTGGIINIILKDNRVQGINGSVNLSAGTRLENGSANLNFRRNGFGLNAFFSGNEQLSSRTPFSQDRLTKNAADTSITRLLQNGYTDFKRKGYQTGIGFDWTLTKKDNLTGSLGYSNFSSRNGGLANISQMTTQEGAFTDPITSLRQSDNRSGINSFDWSLNYRHQFKKEGQELDVVYSSSFGKPFSNYLQYQTYTGEPVPYFGTSGNTPGKDRQTNIQVDYVHPVSKNLVIETGVKTVLQDISSVADVRVFNPGKGLYVKDLSQSYSLTYNMKIYAGYLSAGFTVFQFLDVKAGARFEHTDVNIDFPNTTVPSYNNLVPSVIFSHNFKKEQSLKLAFTRRIERADYRSINPFMNLSDPYNITTGNPLLRPEIGNNFELGYNKSFASGGSIYVALIERINTDDHKPYTTFYPVYMIGDSAYTNVSVTSRQNIGIEYNSGISISGSLPLTSRLNLRGNLMATHKRVVNDLLGGSVTNGVNYRFNLNATYQLPQNLVLEGFGNYASAFNTIQGRRAQAVTYNFAFRKQFWNKNASIGFTATNPFSKYISQVTTITTANYAASSSVLVPYRSFGISLTYKFGKLEFKKGKSVENNYLQNAPSMEN